MTSQSNTSEIILYKTSDGHAIVMIRCRGDRLVAPATQFRLWATLILKEYIIKGFAMNDDRLKQADRWDYFDEWLERVRDIRASEKRFYQKLRDLFALSSGCDSTDKAIQMLFSETQTKPLYASPANQPQESSYLGRMRQKPYCEL